MTVWHDRAEHDLTATILRIDPHITTNLPINVQTETYTDPASGAVSLVKYGYLPET